MAVLAWLVAPVLADRFAGDGHVPMAKALIVSLAIGMVWQFILVATLVRREQRTLRWSTVREALWLRSPRSPRSGRSGGRVWLVVIPLIIGFTAAREVVALVAAPENRDFATLLESDAGKAFLDGAFGWYGLILVMFLFNTVLGEGLLFRGYLLPRMNGAFGRRDWVANGLLFAGYHLHVPWAIPGTLLRCSPPRTRRSGTQRLDPGSRCTAPRASSSGSSSSRSSSERRTRRPVQVLWALVPQDLASVVMSSRWRVPRSARRADPQRGRRGRRATAGSRIIHTRTMTEESPMTSTWTDPMTTHLHLEDRRRVSRACVRGLRRS